ncbi:MAG: Rz1-like lysis system protein LysC [Kiloniellales bacterium]
MRSVSLVLAGLLAACTTPEPVLIRPELPADLFACTPAPPKPASMTSADLANRSNAWAAAYDACQCQLWLVRDLIERREIDPTKACPAPYR